MQYRVQRLNVDHAEGISKCVKGVYGEGYAHEVFYDRGKLTKALSESEVMSVGAVTETGKVIAHMAMTNRGPHSTPELGNTVVAEAARGEGLAWKVGAELTNWCRELGHPGFLHYPTTEHHIMQRQSVKQGIETGLMLGYIPGDEGAKPRQAVTVVYESLGLAAPQSIYLPSPYRQQILEYAQLCKIDRHVLSDDLDSLAKTGSYGESHYEKRGLSRLTVFQAGADFVTTLAAFSKSRACLHLDIVLDEPGVEAATQIARRKGFVFSAWMPGYQGADVLRMQKWQRALTNEAPGVVNPDAIRIHQQIMQEIESRVATG